jgi:hypothetical protein
MPIIIPANSAAGGGYAVDNSCRFNESDDCLIKTFGSAGNRKLWTYSVWFKRGKLGGSYALFVAGASGGNDEGTIRIEGDKIDWQNYDVSDNATDSQLLTSQLIRDSSAWYHLVCSWDSANSTAGDRMKMYLNGTEITSFATDNNPTLNYDTATNNAVLHNIGRQSWNSASDYSGYMAEICFIDGAALTPTSFGEFDEDSGIWKPKSVSGLTFGTNGFYLDFEDSAALGDDVSGNNNDWTPNNLAAVDQSTDTCTNNFATLSPLASGYWSSATFSEGNLKIVSATYASIVSTIAVSQGKWYAEMRSTDISAGTGFMGITSNLPNASNYEAYNQSGSIVGYGVAGNGGAYGNGGSLGNWGSWSNNAIVMMAVDLDNNKLYWGVNGTWGNSSNPSTGSNGVSITAASSTAQGIYWLFCNSETGNNATLEYNFGSPPFAISSGNSDANDHGNFEYAVPTGYLALCTKNLSEAGG